MPAPTAMDRPQFQADVGRSVNTQAPQDEQSGQGYYDISIVKPPVWRWQIASYFFLGGLSAGGYVMARLAERFGDKDFRYVARIGTYVACAAAIPCPLLLIDDLGDPSRFHHMLRVFKPSSPMNLGTWVLSSITPIAFGAALREYLTDRGTFERHPRLRVISDSIGVVADAAGIPLAMLLATYTGVLLSNTANPMWCQNKWLTPLFAIGSFSTGISAIALVHGMTRPADEEPSPAEKTLNILDTVGHACEALAFEGYLHSLGPVLDKPLTRGSQTKTITLFRAGMIASEVIKHLPVRSHRGKRRLNMISSAMGLASAFALRWAVVHGAHESANDPHAAQLSSRARDPGLYGAQREIPAHAPPPDAARDTHRAPDKQAVSSLDPQLGENPRHR